MAMWVLMASHDKEGYVSLHFSYLYLRNVVVPLMMPLTLCDTDTSTSGITQPKESCCTLFSLSWHKECNGSIDNVIGIMLCQSGANGVTWPKSHTVLHFDYLDLRHAVVPLTMPLASSDVHASPKGIIDQKSHIAPQFDCVELRNRVVAFTMWLT